jgi:hypothetical protein
MNSKINIEDTLDVSSVAAFGRVNLKQFKKSKA